MISVEREKIDFKFYENCCQQLQNKKDDPLYLIEMGKIWRLSRRMSIEILINHHSLTQSVTLDGFQCSPEFSSSFGRQIFEILFMCVYPRKLGTKNVNRVRRATKVSAHPRLVKVGDDSVTSRYPVKASTVPNFVKFGHIQIGRQIVSSLGKI